MNLLHRARPRSLGLLAFLWLALLGGGAAAAPVIGHPRLLIRAEDLPGIRARMIPGNDAWTIFKQQIVDTCLRDWKCSATAVYDPVNYQWIRSSFTDENGVVHLPVDVDWGSYANSTERPAVPEDDVGESTGNVRLFTEQYAMIFAFMARLLKDVPGQEAQRLEYLTASKECLFTVVNEAHKGTDPTQPWRKPGFAVQDRSFANESFPLTVDWIYEDLDALELAKVRSAFLHWAQQCNDHVYFAPRKPHGPVNSTNLFHLDEPRQAEGRDELRLALNNHYANHERQMVLYGLALDPKDDVPSAFAEVSDGSPAGSVTSHTVLPGQPDHWIQQPFGVLADTLGVWLYMTDYAYRHDGAGGVSVEGTQYASNGLGPVALLMAALHSAGQDDPRKWGPQVSLEGHPFWKRAVPAYLAQLTPTPRIPGNDTGYQYLGEIFQPPLTGDLETFLLINNQYIKVLAPMALYDARENGTTGQVAQAVRFIQRNLAQGGPSRFAERMINMRSNKTLRDAIYTFLIYDPAAPAPVDPRAALQPRTFFSGHTVNGREMGLVLARSGPTASDTYFYSVLEWNRIDHQRADSLGFGLWKNGLWITKPMTGYGMLQGCSDYRNSLSLQNGVPTSTPVQEDVSAAHGSQWCYSPIGDPQLRARSFGSGYLFVDSDATPLYQHRDQPQLREVTHASRRAVWLKPDFLVLHDVARSKQSGYFKRVFFNTPEPAVVSGNVAHASAREDGVAKAELFVTRLLPAGAAMQTNDIASGQPSTGEDMKARLFTEAPGNPKEARFLHVLQGADAGTAVPVAAQLVASSAGTAFEGAVVGTTSVLFRQDPDSAGDGFTFSVPSTVTRHYLTGLAKSAGFDVNASTVAGVTTLALVPGGTQHFTDSGGVLVLGGAEPATVEIAALDANGAEQGGDPVSFQLQRSGDLSGALTVDFQYVGAATAADFVGAPTSVTFAAGSPVATLTLTPVDDAAFENLEEVVVRVVDGAGYHANEVLAEASAGIVDNDAPAGGYLTFATTAFTADEAAGSATVTARRTGGTVGVVTAVVTAPGLSPAGQVVSWADGDSADKDLVFGVTNDAVYNGDRVIHLGLGTVTGAAAAGVPNAADLTVVDDEPAPPGQITFASGATTVGEGAGVFTIQVQRVNGKGGAVSAGLAASGTATAGVDYTFSPSILTWADKDQATKTVTVTVLQDNAFEGPSESFALALGIVSGAATVGSVPSHSVTINEDDPEPQDYDVGDGQPYPTIGSVPWSILGPGAVVRIHHRAAAYHEKILVSTRGSAAEPIRILGVPGPGGARPVIDGEDATSSASLGYESSSYTPQLGIVAVARGANTPVNGKPGYVEIQGLELRNTVGRNFFAASGAAEPYWTSSGALYLRGAEHVVVRDCEFHHAYAGIVAECYGSELELTRDLLVERCRFHDNSEPGSYSGHNAHVEGIGVTFQSCRFEPTLNRDLTANVRDRSAGLVFRYNRVEGGAPLLELIEPTGAVALVTGDATYPTSHVHGNVLVSRALDGSSLVRFAASYYGDTSLARSLLHFHHNTVVIETSSTSRALFSLSLATTVVEARNNVIHSTSGGFRILSTPGLVNLGVNWGNSGWTPGSGGTVTGGASFVTGANPGFMDFAAADFHPAAASPLRNAAGTLAVGVAPVSRQYKADLLDEPRPTTVDLGAFAYSQPTAADDTAHFARNRTLKIPVATLLANDSSPLGLPLVLASVPATTAQGGKSRLQGSWLVFEPAPGSALDDAVTYTLTDGTRQVQAVVHFLADAASDAPTQNILSTALVPGGGTPALQVLAAGIPGRGYQLQYTADLAAPVAWSNLGAAVTAPAHGRMEFLDPSPASPRFYRVIESAGP